MRNVSPGGTRVLFRSEEPDQVSPRQVESKNHRQFPETSEHGFPLRCVRHGFLQWFSCTSQTSTAKREGLETCSSYGSSRQFQSQAAWACPSTSRNVHPQLHRVGLSAGRDGRRWAVEYRRKVCLVIDFKPRWAVRQWRIARQVWAKPSVRGVLRLVGYPSLAQCWQVGLGQLLVTRTPFRETAKFRPKAHQYKHIQTVDCGAVVSGCNGCFFVNAFAFNEMNRTQCEHAKLTSSSSTRAKVEIESHSSALIAINSIKSKVVPDFSWLLASADPKRIEAQPSFWFHIILDKTNSTISIDDSVIGVKKDELKDHLNTLVRCGTASLLAEALSRIGQSWLGFTSVYWMSSRTLLSQGLRQ